MGHYRVTIQEAAKRLGVKEGAIRKRIERNTIRSEKDIETGRVYVFVDEPPVEDHTDTSSGYEANGEGYDRSYDKGHDTDYPVGYDMLISSQQEQIEFLRRELERKDAILLNMTEAIKSLEAPRDERESSISSFEEQGNGATPPEPEQRRSWLYRFFFGPT